MKRLSTFLVFAFLGFTAARAQSDLLYVAGQNDATPGDAPTLYVQGQADLYVEGGVNIEGTNTRSTNDGLIQVVGTLHIGNYASVGSGNWTNNTGAPLYAYNNNSFPASNTYQPGFPITYGTNANTVSLEYGNQLISGESSGIASTSAPSYFYNLSLLDSTIDRTNVHSFKAVAGADIYIGNTANSVGTLDLNDERLNTQNQIVHLENPSTSTSGTGTAISRLLAGALANSAPYSSDTSGGMVIAANVAISEFNGRLSRVTNSAATYSFPMGTLVNLPVGGAYGTGESWSLFRPAEIISSTNVVKEFAVALAARDGFVDAGAAMDQAGIPWHDLAGINHQSYFKINQLSGAVNDTEQIRLYHTFTTNSDADNYPNWSTCGNLPDADFPQTLTIAQYDNNGINLSWNDVCHGYSTFQDYASSCGSGLTVAPNNDFCNNTVLEPSPGLNSTTTVAYIKPGGFYAQGSGDNTDEDYSIAGLFFTVDGGNGSCDGNCAALPINIISLTGWNVGAENELQWVTATEENVDAFMVEKSPDGINNWEQIGQVESHHYSAAQNTYTFYDSKPFMGHNYYRIREDFYTGLSDLTNLIDVPLNKKIAIANIYPNPTTDNLNVAFETTNAGAIHIEVYDVLGRLVISGDNAVNEGNNTIVVNTSVLTAGSYFIRLIDAQSNFTDTQKFIKITQ